MRRFGLSTAKLNFYEKNPFIFSRKCRGAQTLSFSHRVVYFRSVLQPDQGNKYHIRLLILQGHASLRRFPCSAKPTSPHAQCAARLRQAWERLANARRGAKKRIPGGGSTSSRRGSLTLYQLSRQLQLRLRGKLPVEFLRLGIGNEITVGCSVLARHSVKEALPELP